MDFEAKKLSFLQNQFLQITPFKETKDNNSAWSESKDLSKQLFSTPAKAPAAVCDSLKSHSDSNMPSKAVPSPLVTGKKMAATTEDTWIVTGEINTQVEKSVRPETQTVQVPADSKAEVLADRQSEMLSLDAPLDHSHTAEVASSAQPEISEKVSAEVNAPAAVPEHMPETVAALELVESRLLSVLQNYPDLSFSTGENSRAALQELLAATTPPRSAFTPQTPGAKVTPSPGVKTSPPSAKASPLASGDTALKPVTNGQMSTASSAASRDTPDNPPAVNKPKSKYYSHIINEMCVNYNYTLFSYNTAYTTFHCCK